MVQFTCYNFSGPISSSVGVVLGGENLAGLDSNEKICSTSKDFYKSPCFRLLAHFLCQNVDACELTSSVYS